MMIDPAQMRHHYDRDTLEEDCVPDEPFKLFAAWFEAACAGEIMEPNGMALATSTPDGRPSVRIVLLKGWDRRGFVFYTNYDSRKGTEIEANARASLLFWWDRLHRQVRIEGRVERISPEESDAYFHSRPYDSRIGAAASPQSRITTKTEIEQRFADLEKEHPENPPRPANWGGLRVAPDAIEFWQGRPSRLHDRLRYTPAAHGWTIERLAP